jgi:hypothetical protein
MKYCIGCVSEDCVTSCDDGAAQCPTCKSTTLFSQSEFDKWMADQMVAVAGQLPGGLVAGQALPAKPTSYAPFTEHDQNPYYFKAVSLSRINKIQTYEVQEMELEQLDSIVSSESRHLAFATFSGGVLVSAILSWCAVDASKLSALSVGIHWSVIISSFLFMLSSGWNWISVRRRRPKLLEAIRARSTTSLRACK